MIIAKVSKRKTDSWQYVNTSSGLTAMVWGQVKIRWDATLEQYIVNIWHMRELIATYWVDQVEPVRPDVEKWLMAAVDRKGAAHV